MRGPPHVARSLLNALLPSRDAPWVLAELASEYEEKQRRLGSRAASRWYWREALRSVVPAVRLHWRGVSLRLLAIGLASTAIQALRSTVRQPRHSLGVVATLSLGVSSGAAVLLLGHALLLSSLPYPEGELLVSITTIDVERGTQSDFVSGPDYFDLVEAGLFSEIMAYERVPLALRDRDGFGSKIEVARTTPNVLPLLGVRPSSGRSLLEYETGQRAPRYVVISESLADRLFGRHAAATGESIDLDGRPYLVVGVAPRRPPLDVLDVDAWIPLHYERDSLRRRAGVLSVLAKLEAAKELEQLQPRLDGLAMILESEFPSSNSGRRFVATPLRDALFGHYKQIFAALSAAAGLLTLIAVVNASGLILVRQVRRNTEVHVRMALGASRARVRVQLLLEGLLLGLLTGALSVWIGLSLLRGATKIFDVEIELGRVSILSTGIALAVAVGAAAIATVLALHATRTSFDARATSSRRSASSRSWLLAGQLSATTVLLVFLALLGESLVRVLRIDTGFVPRNVWVGSVDLPSSSYPTSMAVYPDWPEIRHFYDRVIQELTNEPEIAKAAVTWHHPLRSGWKTPLMLEGQNDLTPEERPLVDLRPTSASYLEIVRASRTLGRSLPTAPPGEHKVIVVNERFVSEHLSAVHPIGQRVHFFGAWWEIVGVIRDFKSHGLDSPSHAAVFPSIHDLPSETVQLVVYANSEEVDLTGAMQEAVWRADPQLALYDATSLQSLLIDQTRERRSLVWLFGALSVMGLLLGVSGLVGTVSETVASRPRELGVRVALGASRYDILGLIVGAQLRIAAIGVGVGLVACLWLSRALQNWLFEVHNASAPHYGLVGSALVVGVLVVSIGTAATLLRTGPQDLMRPMR